jgi:hypothetical protein
MLNHELTGPEAYVKGYTASLRTTDCDLDKAEERFTRRHGEAQVDRWLDGWLDAASDRAPKYPVADRRARRP